MRAARRERLRATPLEPERVALIAKRFPHYARLSEEDQRELLGHVQVFLDEKSFEGCGGLELTDEIKLTIAAQACLLLLHRETDYYPELTSILVYPHAYRARMRVGVGGGMAIERDQDRLGESHQHGVVVLSWDDVVRGASDGKDAHNVVLHEFAHQLDQEDGAADGAPILESRAAYAPWARVFQAEFDALTTATEEGRRSDIDAYGATNPAEFFAVVTEAFFEKPEKLATNHPQLYAQLSSYYRQDPLARLGIAFEPPISDAPLVSTPKAKPRRTGHHVELFFLHDEGAAKLVYASAPFRESLIALGCEPRGYLATVHRFPNGHRWGFVVEVFATPDPSVVAATYNVSKHGDGAAFWTLLEDGTIVDTETSHPSTRRQSFVLAISPRQWRERLFVRGYAEPPAALYARHRERVKQIAERRGARPIERDAMEIYAACRLHSTTLSTAFLGRRLRSLPFFQLAVAVVVAILMLRRADDSEFRTVVAAVVVGLIAAAIFGVIGTPLVVLFEQLRVRGLPVPPDRLFADVAAHVKEARASAIAAVLRPKK